VKNKFLVALIAIVSIVIISCEEKPKTNPTPEDLETAFVGTATISIDNEIAPFLQIPKQMFDSAFPDAKISIESITARSAMSKLLNRSARGIIVAREYLKDEDSLMKSFGVQEHDKFKVAEDALVLIVSPSFPLDTINDAQLKDFFSKKETTLQKLFPTLSSEPTIHCLEPNSSVYANASTFLFSNKEPAKSIKFENSLEDILTSVEKGNAIGITYLSSVVFEQSRCKILKIGFADTSGYVSPKTVHQSYIVLRKYPYIVNWYCYQLESRRNFIWSFFTYLSREGKAQRTFLERGIVPAHAKFELILQD
jgi:ABC-type phosphate transport system substrate-binding protein